MTLGMGLIAGIGLLAAVTHGLTGFSRRPRDRTLLALSATSAAMSVGALSVAMLQAAGTEAEHVMIAKWLSFPASVAWTVGTIWFVSFAVDVRPLHWPWAMSAGFAATLLLNSVLPAGLLHATTSESARHGLIHPLAWIHVGLTIVTFAFVLYALFRTRRGRLSRSKVRYLSVALPLFAATMAVDVLGDQEVIGQLLTQIGLLAAVVTSSVAVQVDSLRSTKALQAYGTGLEAMVDARVRDLDAANQALAREVASRTLTEGTLRQRVAGLNALHSVSDSLVARGDLSAGLRTAAKHILSLFEARHVQIDLLGISPDGSLVVKPTSIAVSRAVAGEAVRIPLESGAFYREAASGRQPVLLTEFTLLQMSESTVQLLNQSNIEELLMMPMVVRGEVIGILSVTRNNGRPGFSPQDVRLTNTIADTMAIAVKNERLHDWEKRQAAADERSRLARDLHDAVTQSIYSANLIAEALPTIWRRSPEEGSETLARLRLLVRGALGEMRTLLFELRPSALRAASLDTLLERLGDALAGQAQIPVEVDVSGDIELPVEVRIAFYRVTQEAFSNIAKHAKAHRASVSVHQTTHQVTLTVQDDGRGFDPRRVSSEHMGISILHERLRELGATLSIDSTPGRGTSVVAVWTRSHASRERGSET
jgi:signal transduction histidine kinase